MVRVKICGITDEAALRAAVEADADAVGFVAGVPNSPRNLSLHLAARLMAQSTVFVDTVLVTTERRPEALEKMWMKLRTCAIQVHSATVSEFKAIRQRLPDVDLIGSVHNGLKDPIETALQMRRYVDAVLSDTYDRGRAGGTGVSNDWRLASRIREIIAPMPFLLAGGLNPANVSKAIRQVRPYCVDVSSGVESRPGKKDPRLVRTFIRNAKEAVK